VGKDADVNKLTRASPYLLAGVFVVAGMTHFAMPRPYESIVPSPFPPRETVYASGVAELALAAGLAVRRTRRLTGWVSALFLLAVWPANIKMALDGGRFGDAPVALTWARVPLQIPLILWARAVARRA
jgi:uncharacterized membrane protein